MRANALTGDWRLFWDGAHSVLLLNISDKEIKKAHLIENSKSKTHRRCPLHKQQTGADERAVEALATKPKDLSSVFSNRTVRGESQLPASNPLTSTNDVAGTLVCASPNKRMD